MVSVGDVIAIAEHVYLTCEGVPAAKKMVKTVGKSMGTLRSVLESMPDEYESSTETLPDAMRRPLISLKEHVDKMSKDAKRAKAMSILGYLVRGRGVRGDLLEGMSNVQFSANTLLLAVAETSRQGGEATYELLEDFKRKWEKNEEECRRNNEAEAKARSKKVDEILRLLRSGDANANADLSMRNDLAELGISSQGDLQRAVRELETERDQLKKDLRYNTQAKLKQEEELMQQIANALGQIDLRNVNDHDLPWWCICPISMEVMEQPVNMDSKECECVVDELSFNEFLTKGESTNRCPGCGDRLMSDRIKRIPRLRHAIQEHRRATTATATATDS
mmetsp:Transcript_38533/g.84572  ORF Transcript_38533/g.84572 Transcript_38533/m.84572 type:complete len:335 (+) Transcript_38533:265-1269(+)